MEHRTDSAQDHMPESALNLAPDHAPDETAPAPAPAGGSSFFQNTACEYFPCHPDVPVAQFNCLLCYCPLYALGPTCGGAFSYSENGTKDCSACNLPHLGSSGIERVKHAFPRLAQLANEQIKPARS